jgi:hypothetical protein
VKFYFPLNGENRFISVIGKNNIFKNYCVNTRRGKWIWGIKAPQIKIGVRGVLSLECDRFRCFLLCVLVWLSKRKGRPQSLSFFLLPFVYKSLTTYIQRYINNILEFGGRCNCLIYKPLQKGSVTSNLKNVTSNLKNVTSNLKNVTSNLKNVTSNLKESTFYSLRE